MGEFQNTGKIEKRLDGTTWYDQDYVNNLQQDYERIYNENCKLRKEHNINDISLLDENNQLKEDKKKAIDKLYCYGEAFDGKILQQFQKEMLEILGDKE